MYNNNSISGYSNHIPNTRHTYWKIIHTVDVTKTEKRKTPEQPAGI
jgi:hypothetical protein